MTNQHFCVVVTENLFPTQLSGSRKFASIAIDSCRQQYCYLFSKAGITQFAGKLDQTQAVFSDLSRLEVLGYHQLTEADRTYFELLFSQMIVLPIDRDIIDRAIEIRKSYRTKTADAIIAATAMKLNCSLLTANHNDFKRIEGLALKNLQEILNETKV